MNKIIKLAKLVPAAAVILKIYINHSNNNTTKKTYKYKSTIYIFYSKPISFYYMKA